VRLAIRAVIINVFIIVDDDDNDDNDDNDNDDNDDPTSLSPSSLFLSLSFSFSLFLSLSLSLSPPRVLTADAHHLSTGFGRAEGSVGGSPVGLMVPWPRARSPGRPGTAKDRSTNHFSSTSSLRQRSCRPVSCTLPANTMARHSPTRWRP